LFAQKNGKLDGVWCIEIQYEFTEKRTRSLFCASVVIEMKHPQKESEIKELPELQ
jgi:hypothetical protein